MGYGWGFVGGRVIDHLRLAIILSLGRKSYNLLLQASWKRVVRAASAVVGASAQVNRGGNEKMR
jgi:hypothetical protein